MQLSQVFSCLQNSTSRQANEYTTSYIVYLQKYRNILDTLSLGVVVYNAMKILQKSVTRTRTIRTKAEKTNERHIDVPKISKQKKLTNTKTIGNIFC